MAQVALLAAVVTVPRDLKWLTQERSHQRPFAPGIGKAAILSRGFAVDAPGVGKLPTCSDNGECHPDAIQCEVSVNNTRLPIAHSGRIALVRFSRPKLHHSKAHHYIMGMTWSQSFSSYALEVDGQLRAEFATKDGAMAGGAELKRRFPMLKIRVYDVQTNEREEI